MTLEELKTAARAILELQPREGFSHVTFRTGSGGGPLNHVGIPEVHRDSKFKYNTVRHGNAYAGSVTVECRKLGVQDANGNDLYEIPDGRVFVYWYERGSPERFDAGWFALPVMALGG